MHTITEGSVCNCKASVSLNNTIIQSDHESALTPQAMQGAPVSFAIHSLFLPSLPLTPLIPQFHSSLDNAPSVLTHLNIAHWKLWITAIVFFFFYFWDMTCYLICLALIVLISFFYCVLLCNHWLVSYVDPPSDPLPKLLSIWARLNHCWPHALSTNPFSKHHKIRLLVAQYFHLK